MAKSEDDLAFETPAVIANRVRVARTPTWIRIAFGERGPVRETVFSCATALSVPDATVLRDLLTKALESGQ